MQADEAQAHAAAAEGRLAARVERLEMELEAARIDIGRLRREIARGGEVAGLRLAIRAAGDRPAMLAPADPRPVDWPELPLPFLERRRGRPKTRRDVRAGRDPQRRSVLRGL